MGDSDIQNRNVEHECHINDCSAHSREKAAGLGLHDEISTWARPLRLLQWCRVREEIKVSPDITLPL